MVLVLYSSSGVCVDPVAGLLEDELFVRRSGSREVSFLFIDIPRFVILSSVDDGVKVDAIVAGTSMESC